MPTHDYIISNGTGAAVRSDLNNALAAIVSNNSNSSSPSTTYAYQFWADTSNNVLKIRNSANDAWIELFQLDGTLTLEDGTESLPALAFRDNLSSGIFQSADNKINFSTNGTERLELGTETIFNDGGTDVDFRIEGNSDTDLFFVDASVDLVGIGNNSPKVKLDVARLGAAWTGDTPIAGTAVSLHNGNNAAGSPAYLAILAGSTSISGIIFGDENNSDAGKLFYEHTDDVLRFNVNVDERARINGSGELYVGSTTAAGQGKLFINHSAATTTRAHIRNASATGIVETYYNLDDAKFASVGLENGSLSFRNSTSSTPTLRMIIDSTGQVGIAKSSPVTWNSAYQSLQIFDAAVFYGSNDDSFFGLGSNHYLNTSGNFLYVNSDFASRIFSVDGTFEFHTAPSGTAGAALTFTRRVLIGNLGHQYLSSADTSNASLTLKKTVSGADTIDYLQCRDSSNNAKILLNGNGGISNFQSNDSNLSDETMKKNIVDCESIIDKFKQWKLRKFNYNTDTDGTALTYGVIAQEVETLHSDLVNANFPVDDGVDEEGEVKVTMKKTVKDHQLMMLGFKALQEAIAKIETLETKVAALEAA